MVLADKPETDAFDLLETWQKAGETVADGTDVRQTTVDFKSAAEEAIDYMNEASEGMASGVPSGLTEVDDMTSGWQRGDFIVVGGRPAMGKSALVTTFIKNAADQGYPAALFSLEMSKFQVVCRLVSEDIQLPASDLSKRTLNQDQRNHFKEGISAISHLPITIDDSASLSVEQLTSKARELHRKGKLELLVVDYMQLMSDLKAKSREQEIGSITRTLKKLAKELNIPVIGLSQLSRKVEERDNKRPRMADLRESGSIEQDADMIMFLYRPEYYFEMAGEECPSEYKDKCQLITGKYRNGQGEDIMLDFNGAYSVFKDRSDMIANLRKI